VGSTRPERKLLCDVIERAWDDLKLLRRYDRLARRRELTKSERKRYRQVMKDGGEQHPADWLLGEDCRALCRLLQVPHWPIRQGVEDLISGVDAQ